MDRSFRDGVRLTAGLRRRALAGAVALLATALAGGCAALTNPVGDGVPVRLLPPELLAEPKNVQQTIPLNLLRQPPPDVYRLAAGDVLGIYLEGILPATVPNQTPPVPPVQVPAQFNPLGRALPPAVGFPFPVQPDGTVRLPILGPVSVQGKTLAEAEQAVRDMYVERKIIQPERPILVTLMQQRQVRILVIRQEAGGFTTAGIGGILATSNKRGTGHVIDLPAYENDVLHALALTGGFPGLDAYNAVFVFRGGMSDPALVGQLQALAPGCNPKAVAGFQGEVTVIPLRTRPGAEPPLRPQDVELHAGDIVFVEQRDVEKYYTGGLLPSGEYDLPQNYDLDVVKAIATVKGSLVNGAFGGSNLSGTLIAPGIGNPSPTLLTVLRGTPDGRRVAIRVDLRKALEDPGESLLVRAGDVLILQEKPSEAITRYVTNTLFNFSFTGRVINAPNATGVIGISAPNQIGQITTSVITNR